MGIRGMALGALIGGMPTAFAIGIGPAGPPRMPYFAGSPKPGPADHASTPTDSSTSSASLTARQAPASDSFECGSKASALATPPPHVKNATPPKTAEYRVPGNYLISVYTLDNGHRVVFEPRPGDVVRVATLIDAGAMNEAPLHPSPHYKRDGLAPGGTHLQEHLGYPSDIRAALDALGAQSNASTTNELVKYEAMANREDYERILDLHAQALTRPGIDLADFHREREAVLHESKDRLQASHSSPLQQLHRRFTTLMHDRPFQQLLGTPETVASLTPAHLEQDKADHYRPTKMITAIAGDVDPERVARQLNQTLGQMPVGRPVPSERLKITLPEGKTRYQTLEHPRFEHMSTLVLGFAGPDKARTHADLRELSALGLIMSYLTDGADAVLNRDLEHPDLQRSELGYANIDWRRNGTSLMFEVETRPGDETRSAEVVLERLQNLRTHGIPRDDLKRAAEKSYLRKAREDSQIHDIDEIALRLQEDRPDHVKKLFEMMDEVSRDPEFVRQVAQKYLTPNRYALIVGRHGPEVRESPVQASPLRVPPAAKEAPPSFVQKPAASLNPFKAEALQSASDDATSRSLGTKLRNGAHAHLQQLGNAKTSRLTFVLPGNRYLDPAVRVLPGASSHELRDFLSDLAAEEGIHVTPYWMGERNVLEVSGPSRDEARVLQIGMALLKHLETDAAHVKSIKSVEINSQTRDPEKNWETRFAPDDPEARQFYGPRHPLGRPRAERIAEVEALTQERLEKLMRQVGDHPARIPVSFVSPHPPERQQRALNEAITQTRFFENPRDPLPPIGDATVPPPALTQGRHVLPLPSPSEARTTASFRWKGPAPRDPDYAAYRILQAYLLSRDGLYGELRGKRNLIYGLDSRTERLRDYSVFEVAARFDHDRSGEGLTAMDGFLRKFRDPQNTASPLFNEAALGTLKRQLALEERLKALDGETLAELNTRQLVDGTDGQLPQKLQQVTTADLRRVADRYFNPEHGPLQIVIRAPPRVLAGLPRAFH